MRKYLLISLIFLILMACQQDEKCFKSKNYSTLLNVDDKSVDVSLKWNDLNFETGEIEVDFHKRDILKGMLKYSFYRNGDTITLSDIFQDNVSKYYLKCDKNQNLLISTISKAKDPLIFGIRVKEIKLKADK